MATVLSSETELQYLRALQRLGRMADKLLDRRTADLVMVAIGERNGGGSSLWP